MVIAQGKSKMRIAIAKEAFNIKNITLDKQVKH
jgi:hypothetical protein